MEGLGRLLDKRELKCGWNHKSLREFRRLVRQKRSFEMECLTESKHQTALRSNWKGDHIAFWHEKWRHIRTPEPSFLKRLLQRIRNILMGTKSERRESRREKNRKGMKMDGRSIKTLMANREAVARMNK